MIASRFALRGRLWMAVAGSLLVSALTCNQSALAQGGDLGSIIGVVRNAATEAPIAGATVHLSSEALAEPQTTVSGGDGLFDFGELPAAVYVLEINELEGFELGEGLERPSRKVVELPAGATEDVAFLLQPLPDPLGAIVGVVRNAETEEPIEGATVHLGSEALGEPREAVTNPNGFFEFGELLAGVYVLEIGHLEGFDLGEGPERPSRKVVELPAGATEDVVFSLQPLPDPLGTIIGVVRNAQTEEGIAGVRVVLASEALGEPRDAATGPEGFFEFVELPAGVYVLEIDHLEGFDLGEGPERPSRRIVELPAGATEDVVFSLQPLPDPLGTIVGVVRNAQTEEGISGVTVHLGSEALGEPRNAVTGPEGFFEFVELPAGVYVLEIDHLEGFDLGEGPDRPSRKVVELPAGATEDVAFLLHPLEELLGRIIGVVRNAQTEEPIEGAKVFLGGEGLNEPRMATTNPNGFFEFNELSAGLYVLEIDHLEGFDLGEGPDRPSRKVVELSAGATEDVLFEFEPLEDGLGKIVGVVRNAETQEPIAGARIHLVGPELDEGRVTESNGDGLFKFLELPAGRYVLEVDELDGFELGEGPDRPSRKVVELGPGEIAEVIFEFHPLDEPLGRIVGVVRNAETEEPIAGAEVFAVGPDGREILHRTETNGDGFFEFEGLAGGLYVIEVEAEGFRPGRGELELPAGGVEDIGFRLEPIEVTPGAIHGRVVNADTGDPIAGAQVFYHRFNDDPPMEDERAHDPDQLESHQPDERPFVVTNENGFYVIEELRPGRYHLLAKAEGFRAEDANALVESGDEVEVNFELIPRAPSTGAIFGRVTDAETGDPIAGARVAAIHDGDVDPLSSSPAEILGSAETNENGEYEIGGLPAGPIKVVASKDGYRKAEREATVIAGEAEEVNLKLHPIPIARKGDIVGIVRDAETEAPIARAFVALIPDQRDSFDLSTPLGSLPFALTDEDGRFAFRDVPVGNYRLVAKRAGYRRGVERVTVAAGQVSEVRFLLFPADAPRFGELVGRVTSVVTGEPLAGVRVRLESDDYEWLTERHQMATSTDATGMFVFGHVKAGEYQVHAAKRGYETSVTEVEVIGGRRTIHDIELAPLPRLGSIGGIVSDEFTGDPIPEAIVFVPRIRLPHSASAPDSTHARTDEEGHYRIEGLEEGRHVVVAFHRGYFLDAQVIRVEARETTELNFGLLPRPGLPDLWRILTIDALTGNPIRNAQVHLPITGWLAPGSEFDPWFGHSGTLGDVFLGDVPRGSWTAIATADGYQPAFEPLADGPSPDGKSGVALSEPAGFRTMTIVLEPTPGQTSAADWILFE